MKADKIILFCVIFLAILTCIWLLTEEKGVISALNNGPVQVDAVSSNLPLKNKSSCLDISGLCVATAETSVTGCDQEVAKKNLHELLAMPLEDEKCKEAQKDFEFSCESGCIVDYPTMFTVYGSVIIDQRSGPDSGGECKFLGSRAVSMRANCKPAKTSP